MLLVPKALIIKSKPKGRKVGIMPTPTSIAKLVLDAIVRTINPRTLKNQQYAEMRDDLRINGMHEPIHVWRHDGVDELLKGYRRIGGAELLRADFPADYEKHFPEGIPAIVWEGITAEEALLLKLDHGNQVSLSDPYELQMSATLMFNQGFTEAEVANHLRPLITKISPMPAKAKAEIEELEKALAEAKVEGNDSKISEAEKAVEKRVAELYRGRVQHLHNVARCPEIVDASLYFKANNEKPVGFEDKALPKLTTSQVTGLWKEHKKDLEILDEETQAPKYNKVRVGPNFTEKWNAILKAEAESADDNTPRDKAMSGKDMKAEITEGKWSCVGFYKLTKRHTGDKTVEGLEELDKAYYALDLVSKHKSSLFDKVLAEGAKIADRLRAEAEATAEAEAKETEEVAS